tara:strand:- start:2002 stop:2262 length:261 start_codon:yes stop_codon:yes gene_type:complete
MTYIRNKRNRLLENRDDWKEEIADDIKELNVLMPDKEQIRQRLYTLRKNLETEKSIVGEYTMKVELTEKEILRQEKRLNSFRHLSG